MRICTSINTLSQANVGAPSTTGRRRPPARSAVDGPGRSVRPPCAQIRFWRAASREPLRRRRTPTRHRRGAPARTAWGGRVGDPGAPGADDGVAGESVQCRPGRSPGGAVDVCRVTPQASRRGGLAAIRAQIRTGQVLGKFPKVVTRLTGTLDRIAARRRAQPATDTFSQICATGVGGADAHGDGLSLTQRLQRRGQRRPPGLLPGPSTVMVPPVPPVAAHQEPPSRRYRRSRWGGYDPGRSHPRPSPPVLAVTGRCCRRSQR